MSSGSLSVSAAAVAAGLSTADDAHHLHPEFALADVNAISIQDRKDQTLQVLKSELMAKLDKEVKSLDDDSWMFDGPRSRINLISRPGCMDLDYALRTEQPASLTDASSPDERRNLEKWECSSPSSLMIIKRGIPNALWGTTSKDITRASEYLAEIEKRFFKNDKAETSMLLTNLISMKYKGKGNIREYIIEMSHTASKLRALKLEVSEDLLLNLVLMSLPAQFN